MITHINHPRTAVYDGLGHRIENVCTCDAATGQCWHYVLDPLGNRIDGQYTEKKHPAPLEISFI